MSLLNERATETMRSPPVPFFLPQMLAYHTVCAALFVAMAELRRKITAPYGKPFPVERLARRPTVMFGRLAQRPVVRVQSFHFR